MKKIILILLPFLLLPLIMVTPLAMATNGLGLDPNNYQAGYQYGNNEWSEYGPGSVWDMHHLNMTYSFECPLAGTAATNSSNFCQGYDAALKAQNSDQ
jgi:hypothetical protein